MNRKNIISTLLCTLIAVSINFGALAMDDSTTEQGTDSTNSQQYNGDSSESSPFSVTSEEEESTQSADAPSEEIYEVE